MMPLLFRRHRLSLRRKRCRSLSVSTRAARGLLGQTELLCVSRHGPARPDAVHATMGIGHVGGEIAVIPIAHLTSNAIPIPYFLHSASTSRLLESRFGVANSSSSIGINLRKRTNCLTSCARPQAS
jgi:hypothetical protein